MTVSINPVSDCQPQTSELSVTAGLKQQLNSSVQQLSLDGLRSLAEFAAYLADAESEAATQELLAIPGLLEQVKKSQATHRSEYVNWRTIRSDV